MSEALRFALYRQPLSSTAPWIITDSEQSWAGADEPAVVVVGTDRVFMHDLAVVMNRHGDGLPRTMRRSS